MAVARLQAVAELEVHPVYRDNMLVEIKVRVRNIRAGHNLPTSLSNIRQVWLEVTASDRDGNIIMTTGTVDEKGNLPEGVRLFNKDAQGEHFHFVVDPWLVASFARDDTILPRGFRDVHYGLFAEKGVPITLELKLRYRQADQKVAEHILSYLPPDMDLYETYGLNAVPVLPVIDMVVKNVTI